jgi:hypothetical protein
MICVEKEIHRDNSYNQLDLRFVCHADKHLFYELKIGIIQYITYLTFMFRKQTTIITY